MIPAAEGGARLLELVEDFTGWWHLHREGSVNAAYRRIDEFTKAARKACEDAAPAPLPAEIASRPVDLDAVRDWVRRAMGEIDGWGNHPAVPIGMVKAMLYEIEILRASAQDAAPAPLPALPNLEELIAKMRLYEQMDAFRDAKTFGQAADILARLTARPAQDQDQP
jgi:hypothetical protein